MPFSAWLPCLGPPLCHPASQRHLCSGCRAHAPRIGGARAGCAVYLSKLAGESLGFFGRLPPHLLPGCLRLESPGGRWGSLQALKGRKLEGSLVLALRVAQSSDPLELPVLPVS